MQITRKNNIKYKVRRIMFLIITEVIAGFAVKIYSENKCEKNSS